MSQLSKRARNWKARHVARASLLVALSCSGWLPASAHDRIICPNISLEEAYGVVSTYLPDARLVGRTIVIDDVVVLDANATTLLCKKDQAITEGYTLDAVNGWGPGVSYVFRAWTLDMAEATEVSKAFTIEPSTIARIFPLGDKLTAFTAVFKQP